MLIVVIRPSPFSHSTSGWLWKFLLQLKQSNQRDLIAETGHHTNWIQIIEACETLKLDGWPQKNNRALFYTPSSFGHHLKSSKFRLETLNSGQNRRFFVPFDLEIWWMTLKNNRAPLLCCFKLCASFHSQQWIQTRVTVRKCPIWVKIDVFLSCVTFKFDRRPWKTIGHLFYATSSFVHHFVAIGEFKLELQSGNAQFGSKSMIFLAVWPWNLTDDLEK